MPAVADGLGWLIEKTAMLMKTYGWSEDYVMDELDGAKGWVWLNWARENEASVWGAGLKIKGDGYVAQERRRLMDSK